LNYFSKVNYSIFHISIYSKVNKLHFLEGLTMDIVIFLVGAAVVAGLIYFRLNKDKEDGSHPLDTLGNKNNAQPTQPPVQPVAETKPVEPVKVEEPKVEEPKVEVQQTVVVEETKTKKPVKTGKTKVTARVKNTKVVEKVPAKKGRKPKVTEPAKKVVARKLKNS